MLAPFRAPILHSVDLVKTARFIFGRGRYVRKTIVKQIKVLQLKELSFFTIVDHSLLRFLFYTTKFNRIESDAKLDRNIEWR